MATVLFSRALAQRTGGVERIEVQAERVGDLIATLHRHFPELDGELDDMAVSIDDVIHTHAVHERLERESVVVFVPRIGGG